MAILSQFAFVAQNLLEHRCGGGVGGKQTQRLSLGSGVWWIADDGTRCRIGFRVYVITEKLQRLLRWDQRFFRVLQSFQEFLLDKAILLARQNTEHALT